MQIIAISLSLCHNNYYCVIIIIGPHRGIPNILSEQNNHAARIPTGHIPTADEAVQSFYSSGGHLSPMSQFGTDPLSDSQELLSSSKRARTKCSNSRRAVFTNCEWRLHCFCTFSWLLSPNHTSLADTLVITCWFLKTPLSPCVRFLSTHRYTVDFNEHCAEFPRPCEKHGKFLFACSMESGVEILSSLVAS